MGYNRTVWVNDSVPAINAENLNKIENGIVESNIFRNLLNVGDAKITANTGLNFNKTNNQILINGSSTTETNIFLDSPNANKDKDGIILKAGTYTATIKKESGLLANNPITFYLRKSNGTSIYDGTVIFSQIIEAGVSDGTTYSSTFTLTEETRLHWLGYFGSDLRTFNNLILEFQIEESPTPTSYMPWAGYIVESGSNDNGSWVKYSDGTMICRNTFPAQAIINKPAGGNWYYDQPNINKSFPQEFVGEYPQISIEIVNSPDGGGDWGQIHMNYIDLTKISSVVFKDTVSSDNSKTFNLSYIAIGKWK